ncbi:MAG: hypothetical protein SGPRY_009545 [Prymnesium sp.]
MRARDWELSAEDVKRVQTHMNQAVRPEHFRGAHVKHLVTTEVKRDQVNKSQQRSEIERGAPAMRIEAIDSDKAGAIYDDEFGLVNVLLLLCFEARVMITKNLCIAHGLVNSTTGVVEDIIVDADGVPTSVLVHVRKM